MLNALDVEINLSKKQKYLAAHRNTKLPLTPFSLPDEVEAFRDLLFNDPTISKDSRMER